MSGKYPLLRVAEAVAERLHIGRLGRNTLLSTAGLGTRAIIQASYLIVVSRWMGAYGYGLFTGSMAASLLLAPLSGWGASYIVAQRVGRDPAAASSMWASALTQIVISGALLTVVLMLVSAFLLSTRVSMFAMLLLSLAEVMVLPAAQAAATVFLAKDRGGFAAVVMCLVPAFRLLAALLLLGAGGNATPANLAATHFVGSVFGVALAMHLLSTTGVVPAWKDRLSVRSMTTEGSSFAFGAIVGTSYPEIDKVLLLQLLGAMATGTYTAAFRVASVLLLPIAALVSSALPRLFAAEDSRARKRTLKLATIASMGYSALAMAASLLVAPWMPAIFGADFVDSSRYLILLSPWVLVYALHQCSGVGLTTSGRQGMRAVIETGGLLVVLLINLLLLRVLGPSAAALALLAAETFMAFACWIAIRRQAPDRES